jgi:signal recognition particle receptor subunit beta
MVVLNYTGGEINAKIVYYGPGVSGKTTNLEFIHEKTPNNAKGKMVSMKTQTDRTLFFDFLPLELGEINGYRTRFLLYTVPGQVYYNATRKLVLKGVDAVVFVADSSRAKLDENLESLRNLEQNLNEHGLTLDEIPWVIQYNKRDLPDAVPFAELDAKLNPLKKPSFEAVASKGTGVYETFHGIATMVYRVLKDRLEKGELSTEIGDTAPAQHAEPTRPGAKAPAPRTKTPTDEIVATRPTRPAAPAPAPPKRPVAAAPPEPPAATDPFEYDDHVDMMLREVDAPAAKPAAPKPAAKPAAPAPRKAPAPEPAPPAKAPGRRLAEMIEPKVPPRAAPRTPAPPAPVAEAPADENLFAAIPESRFDMELGRLPELDEASEASETAREEGPDEFVTDPMRRVDPKPVPAKAPEPPRELHELREAGVAVETRAQPEKREVRVAVDTHTTQEIREVRVAVPLVLTRAQLEGGAPIRVVFDVKIID